MGRELFKLLRVSEEGNDSTVERAQGIPFLGVLKSQEVPVGRISERNANFGFLEDCLDRLRLFEILLVGNLGGCSKPDDLLHLHHRHLRKTIAELLVPR